MHVGKWTWGLCHLLNSALAFSRDKCKISRALTRPLRTVQGSFTWDMGALRLWFFSAGSPGLFLFRLNNDRSCLSPETTNEEFTGAPFSEFPDALKDRSSECEGGEMLTALPLKAQKLLFSYFSLTFVHECLYHRIPSTYAPMSDLCRCPRWPAARFFP